MHQPRHENGCCTTHPVIPEKESSLLVFSYRIKSQNNFESQLFPDLPQVTTQAKVVTTDSKVLKWAENVQAMRCVIRQKNLCPSVTTPRGVVNVFSGIEATTEQAHDLLNARKTGEQSLSTYITHHLLQKPSTDKPSIRRKRLLTMAPSKKKKAKLSQREKEEKEINCYLRRRLAWCNQTGLQFDEGEEQYSILPRALAEVDGSLPLAQS